MDMTFTGRGVQVTDEIRGVAEQKLAPISRMEPRATNLDLELINEHHPKPDGLKRVEATLRIPRKTFRAHAEADDVPTAIDRVRDKLERQLRDHHGKKKTAQTKGALGYAEAATAEIDAE
ncbi:MAG TPA: ribosome-associated translation inhibitor RaiA [Actinomycetota bacterium]|nr:ribosome-associated translation inhibitor RaiA [Actinomycetota bacterium]